MLIKDLDWSAIRQDLSGKGYTKIKNVLEPGHAEIIANAVLNETTWDLCYLSNDGPVSITHNELQEYTGNDVINLQNNILTKAKTGFSYYYYRTDFVNNTNPMLKNFYNYLCGDGFLGFARYITDELSINTVNGQLTCYRPGCFLKRHNDTTSKEHRIVAYVFGFTPKWHNDWGGLLLIENENRNIIDSYKPEFNTLTIFKVPTWHSVSQVANYAQGARYTITGWVLAP